MYFSLQLYSSWRRNASLRSGIWWTVKAGLLVHKPGISSPKYHIQKTKDHRYVRGSHTRHRDELAQRSLNTTRLKLLDNAGTGSCFNICKSFSPGRSAHQPQKSRNNSNYKVSHGKLSIITIQVCVTNIEEKSSNAVQEDKDWKSDIELRRRGVISNKDITFPIYTTDIYTLRWLKWCFIQPTRGLWWSREAPWEGWGWTGRRASSEGRREIVLGRPGGGGGGPTRRSSTAASYF